MEDSVGMIANTEAYKSMVYVPSAAALQGNSNLAIGHSEGRKDEKPDNLNSKSSNQQIIVEESNR